MKLVKVDFLFIDCPVGRMLSECLSMPSADDDVIIIANEGKKILWLLAGPPRENLSTSAPGSIVALI